MLNQRSVTVPVVKREEICLKRPAGFSTNQSGVDCLRHSANANHIELIGSNMAHHILAATPLSNSDITGLAQLFEQAFCYHRQHWEPFKKTHWQVFQRHLRTVVGLSYAVTLIEGDLKDIFNSHLRVFLRHQAFLNINSEHAKLARAFANMVSLGSDFFRCLDHPCYYEDFLIALRCCILHIINEIEISLPLKAKEVVALILS